jgi:hypothetical protein
MYTRDEWDFLFDYTDLKLFTKTYLRKTGQTVT